MMNVLSQLQAAYMTALGSIFGGLVLCLTVSFLVGLINFAVILVNGKGFLMEQEDPYDGRGGY